MQSFDENNIKKTFDKWDNTPVSIGYNKQNIRQQMPFAQKSKWQQHIFKAAAIALICILSGSLAYALYKNQYANKNNQLLASEHNKYQQEISQLKAVLLQNKNNNEVQYVTVVKEKLVSDPNCNENQLQLQNKITQLEDENMSLKESLNQLALASDDLNDSIQTLLANMDEIQQEYLTVLDKIKSKQSFEINYDQKLITSNKNQQTQDFNSVNENKIKLKIGTGNSNNSAPYRNNFTIR